MSSPELRIRRATVNTTGASDAAEQLFARLGGEGVALAVVFIPPEFDRAALCSALNAKFAGTPIIGCTTAGEIGPQGVGQNGIVGFSLPASHFRVAVERLTHLDQFVLADGAAMAGKLLRKLADQGLEARASQTFGMLLVDGLSAREELIASTLDGALGGIPLFGGSAGDGLRFESTAVLADGKFESDSAVVVLIQSSLPFQVFKTQHLVLTDRKLIVTATDRGSRTVMELDGEAAALAYARAVGVRLEDLTPEVYAAHPVVVRLGGSNYVRSIQRRNDDDSLTFMCAIDEGLVLSLAETGDLVATLGSKLEHLRRDLGPLELVIGCDCILRRLEAERLELAMPLEGLFREHQVVGFGTYGEQYHGVHVNQTFTGVAIGRAQQEAA